MATKTQTAEAAHNTIINRLRAATTPAELAGVLADITELNTPGFPDNSADGSYFDGRFIATFASGKSRMTDIWAIGHDFITLLGEIQLSRKADRDAQRDAERATADTEKLARRGRPEIGRPVQIRLPEWLLDTIDRYADAHDLSRAEAMRKLIIAGHLALKTN